jgi:hypothetical protein
MKWITVALVVVFCLSTLQVFADNFSCPNGNIVSTGDSLATVEAKCDPPTFKSKNMSMSAPIHFNTEENPCKKSNEPYVESMKYPFMEWTYTQGSSMEHILIFYMECLREVRTGGFVK